MNASQAVSDPDMFHAPGTIFGRKMSHGPTPVAPEAVDEPRDPHATAGEEMRLARLAADLSVDEFATETRIPVRVLRAIESYDFSDPRSRIGAITGAIKVARRLGIDEARLSREVRAALVRLPEQVTPAERVDDAGDRFVALVAAAALFLGFVALAAGLGALLLR